MQMVKRLMLGVRVTDEMMAALKIEAAKERRTVSAWVENLLFDILTERGHNLNNSSDASSSAPQSNTEEKT